MPPKATAPVKNKAPAPQQKAAAKKAEVPKQAVAKPTAKGVYIKGLKNEGVDDVKKIFSAAGNISSVTLRRNNFALVHFTDGESAQKAIQRFNGKTVEGNQLTVVAAKAAPRVDEHENSSVVFVAPVYRECTKRKEILDFFAECGKVVRLRTYANHTAFVYFDTPEGAKNAVQKKNGTKFHSAELRIKPSVRSLQKDKKKEERRTKLIEVYARLREQKESK